MLVTLFSRNKYYWVTLGLSRWPSSTMRTSPATCLLELWDRIPPGSWMFVSCECFVLSGRDVCEGPIPHPQESYRVCVTRRNIYPLHLQWVGRRGQAKKERRFTLYTGTDCVYVVKWCPLCCVISQKNGILLIIFVSDFNQTWPTFVDEFYWHFQT